MEDDEKTYEFKLVMTGRGKTPQEAWADASEGAIADPNDFCSTEDIPDWEVVEE